MKSTIAAIVLAAGLSTRMGRPKALLPFGGQTIIEHLLAVLERCPVDEILVVTGHERDAVERLLNKLQVRAVFNPHYATGEMLSSIQVGLNSMSPHANAALIVLGDQPLLEHSVIEQIVAVYHAGRGKIVIPSYQRRRGHPVLIDRAHWEGILSLGEQQSLRDYLRGLDATAIYHLDVDTPNVLSDMDTPADYERVLANYLSRDQSDSEH